MWKQQTAIFQYSNPVTKKAVHTCAWWIILTDWSNPEILANKYVHTLLLLKDIIYILERLDNVSRKTILCGHSQYWKSCVCDSGSTKSDLIRPVHPAASLRSLTSLVHPWLASLPVTYTQYERANLAHKISFWLTVTQKDLRKVLKFD